MARDVFLGPDHARQLVVYAPYDAHDLPRAERRAGGRSHPGATDLGEARPARSVVNVGIEHIVNRSYSAHKLARSLCGATGIVIHSAADSEVARPVSQNPGAAVEKSPLDSRAIGFREAHTSTTLTACDLRGANLAEANLRGASLRECDLRGANLDGADLRGTYYDELTRWPEGFDPGARGAVLD